MSRVYNFNEDESGEGIVGGVDCSIRGTHHSATHGSQSSVMTVCENMFGKLVMKSAVSFVTDYYLVMKMFRSLTMVCSMILLYQYRKHES